MEHCHNNLKLIKEILDRRNSEEGAGEIRYQRLVAHAASCASCARNLQTLQDEEFRQQSTPQPVKLRFGGKGKRQR